MTKQPALKPAPARDAYSIQLTCVHCGAHYIGHPDETVSEVVGHSSIMHTRTVGILVWAPAECEVCHSAKAVH